MDEKLGNDFKKRQAETLAMARNPYNWLTDGEKAALEESKMKIEEWVELTCGITTQDLVNWRKQTQEIHESPPKKPKKLPLLPAHNKPAKRKENCQLCIGLRLLESYSATSKSGETLTITKLSRSFCEDEEDIHRSFSCDLIDECLNLAIKFNIRSFSCVKCEQYYLSNEIMD